MVLCSRSARPQKGLARRPQLDQQGILSGKGWWIRTRTVEDHPGCPRRRPSVRIKRGWAGTGRRWACPCSERPATPRTSARLRSIRVKKERGGNVPLMDPFPFGNTRRASVALANRSNRGVRPSQMRALGINRAGRCGMTVDGGGG